MYTISKRFEFSASHILHGLPGGHPCGRMHGHNYTVDLELSAEKPDDIGFVMDFGELNGIRDWLNETFDHQHLNDRQPYNPTSEWLAHFIYSTILCWLPAAVTLSAVRVSETPKTWAEYRP